MADEDTEKEYRSEPLRCILHGIPGAGKSEVLQWLRTLFEDICSWTHGTEFAYLTSMNSMAELINGQTWHSFFGLSKMNEYGEAVTTGKGLHGEHGVNKSFLDFARLRWLFIDECSTLGCELLAFGDDRARQYIRQSYTWSLRRKKRETLFRRPQSVFLWRLLAVQTYKDDTYLRQSIPSSAIVFHRYYARNVLDQRPKTLCKNSSS